MNKQQDYVIIKKGDEEHYFYGDTLRQMIAGGKLNSALLREEKKPSYILIVSLTMLFVILLCVIPENHQTLRFLSGSVISTALGVHMYIIYEKKFLLGGIAFIGIMISLLVSKLLSVPFFTKIMQRLL